MIQGFKHTPKDSAQQETLKARLKTSFWQPHGGQSVASGAPQASAPNNHALASQATNGSGSAQANGAGKRAAGKASTRRTSSPQAKVTKLLFAVSFTFLMLSLPSHIVRIRMTMLVMTDDNSHTPNLDQMLQVVFQILYYMSFAVNLLVYLSFGESFRNVFVETYLRCVIGRGTFRRRSEVSHTSYTAVRLEVTEAPTAEKKEEETSLIS